MRTRPFSELCAELARLARQLRQETLGYVLDMAALEATTLDTRSCRQLALSHQLAGSSPSAVGVWDWDVANDVRYLDPTAAALFGHTVDKQHGVFKADALISRIHPDDHQEWLQKVKAVSRLGGIYEHTYRIIANGKVNFVYSKGFCALSRGGTPERFPGVIVHVTEPLEIVRPIDWSLH